MRRQGNMAQMKEQIKTPEKQLKEMGVSNLSDAEFKTLVIRMLRELSEDHKDHDAAYLSSIKKIQSDMKDSLIERENNLQRNNSGVDEAKNQINDLEQKEPENNNAEQQEENKKKNEESYKQPLGQL